MTTFEIAAAAEKAVDALTVALNAQPATPDVVEKLRGIAHGLLLAVGTIASTGDGDTAEAAGAASDTLLAVMPGLDDLVDALRQDEDRHLLAA